MGIDQLIEIYYLSTAPYFQVDSSKRIRFSSVDFDKKNWNYLKNLIHLTFEDEEKIDCTFIIGHIINNKKIYHKIGLGKFFDINNWSEKIIYEQDRGEEIIFATVKNVSKNEIYKFVRAITSCFIREVEITFHSKHYLSYVNGDVLDIVSNDEKNIERIKKNISKLFVYEQEEQEYLY
ncbi:hypothetical protein MM221_16345 [Salipaludibacillus sp. LMS25]|jgi:hypothetical protein|uniref:hypothetical protein n=1 Tax=Salipaludibacillus sp. LMS25 TaxID=2924031 RepID=UPI0020D1831A|nr:hypothetical protein [Salipaludibacillus sp. LMS25]UTR14130.1 hypothetical protein MM221_16345 [Salipaludibacillus sp. LMS25]